MKKVKLMLVGFIAIVAFGFGADAKEASFYTSYTKSKTDNTYVGFTHGKFFD